MSTVSKLAKVLTLCFSASIDRILVTLERSKMYALTTKTNLSIPTFRSTVDASFPRLGISSGPMISLALRWIANAKIAVSIVKSQCRIDMVSKSRIIFGQAEDKAMHHDCVLDAIAKLVPLRIKGLRIFRPFCIPIPTIQAGILRSVYRRILPARKGNQFDRLILRLDNSVTLHVVLHKEPHIPCAVVRPLCIV